jgi:hypothetical protein
MIRARLMALDYVLENEDEHYLASERERRQFFTETRGIRAEYLPGDSSFSATFPVSIADRMQPAISLVRFVFIDEGLLSMHKFSRFLADMAPLLHELGTFELFYVACADYNFPAAEHEFRRQFQPLVPPQQRLLRQDWRTDAHMVSQQHRARNAQFTTLLFHYSYPPIQRNEPRGSVHGSEAGSEKSSVTNGVA